MSAVYQQRIDDANQRAVNLYNERMDRSTRRHTDTRIPGEILEKVRDIGSLRKELVSGIERHRRTITESLAAIEEIDRVYSKLWTEMQFATGYEAQEVKS